MDAINYSLPLNLRITWVRDAKSLTVKTRPDWIINHEQLATARVAFDAGEVRLFLLLQRIGSSNFVMSVSPSVVCSSRRLRALERPISCWVSFFHLRKQYRRLYVNCSNGATPPVSLPPTSQLHTLGISIAFWRWYWRRGSPLSFAPPNWLFKLCHLCITISGFEPTSQSTRRTY